MSLPPLDIVSLLRRYGLRPDKSLGQNFLADPAALQQVIEAAQISPVSDILEIGPGLGSLTRLLALRARRVVAVELDARLLAPLEAVLAPYPNVEVVQGDILALDPVRLMRSTRPELEPGLYGVVANIPYYITSAVIRHLLEASVQPASLTLTVQREVAERICAPPGSLNLLALSVQVYSAVQIVAYIPASAFYPAPQVDSAIARLDIYPSPVIPSALLPSFFRLARAGFSQKRKNLRNALAGGMGWSTLQAEQMLGAAGIDARRRAETLSLAEWQRLVDCSTELPK